MFLAQTKNSMARTTLMSWSVTMAIAPTFHPESSKVPARLTLLGFHSMSKGNWACACMHVCVCGPYVLIYYVMFCEHLQACACKSEFFNLLLFRLIKSTIGCIHILSKFLRVPLMAQCRYISIRFRYFSSCGIKIIY